MPGPVRDGASERVNDMHGILTKRLHIDLGRVASAFCCR
ncbi:putative leader peptide [Actinacidiphila polyblastidii]